MTINYEIVNIIIGAAFILSIAWMGKFNVIKAILSIMTVVCIMLPPSAIYFILLSSISLIQAWYLISKARNTSSYKYLIYSFLFIFMNIPTVSIYYRLLLICILLLKTIIASYKDEVADPFMFVLNAALIAGMALNIQPLNQASIIPTILFFMIVIGSLRYLFDKSVKTPLYILPLFILATVSSGNIIITLSALYAFLTAVIYVNNKEKIGLSFICLFSIPFIDNSFIYIAVKNIVSSLSFVDQEYALWSIIAISAIVVMKFYEQDMISSLKGFKFRHIIEILFAAGISLAAGFSTYELSHPIPLFCIIPLIIIEARYIHLVNKIPMASILAILERIFNRWYGYKKDITRTVYIRSRYSIRTILRKLFIFPKVFMIVVRRYYSKTIIYTIKNLRRSMSLSASFIEVKIIKKISVEELIAIISAITVLLIYFLGDK